MEHAGVDVPVLRLVRGCRASLRRTRGRGHSQSEGRHNRRALPRPLLISPRGTHRARRRRPALTLGSPAIRCPAAVSRRVNECGDANGHCRRGVDEAPCRFTGVVQPATSGPCPHRRRVDAATTAGDGRCLSGRSQWRRSLGSCG
jgi:hypothetical protein